MARRCISGSAAVLVNRGSEDQPGRLNCGGPCRCHSGGEYRKAQVRGDTHCQGSGVVDFRCCDLQRWVWVYGVSLLAGTGPVEDDEVFRA